MVNEIREIASLIQKNSEIALPSIYAVKVQMITWWLVVVLLADFRILRRPLRRPSLTATTICLQYPRRPSQHHHRSSTQTPRSRHLPQGIRTLAFPFPGLLEWLESFCVLSRWLFWHQLHLEIFMLQTF